LDYQTLTVHSIAKEVAMDVEGMASEFISAVGDFINIILGALINLFNSVFNFLPPNLRTGFGVVVLIIIGVIIFFLWRRD
jgi:hypothetical protein